MLHMQSTHPPPLGPPPMNHAQGSIPSSIQQAQSTSQNQSIPGSFFNQTSPSFGGQGDHSSSSLSSTLYQNTGVPSSTSGFHNSSSSLLNHSPLFPSPPSTGSAPFQTPSMPFHSASLFNNSPTLLHPQPNPNANPHVNSMNSFSFSPPSSLLGPPDRPGVPPPAPSHNHSQGWPTPGPAPAPPLNPTSSLSSLSSILSSNHTSKSNNNIIQMQGDQGQSQGWSTPATTGALPSNHIPSHPGSQNHSQGWPTPAALPPPSLAHTTSGSTAGTGSRQSWVNSVGPQSYPPFAGMAASGPYPSGNPMAGASRSSLHTLNEGQQQQSFHSSANLNAFSTLAPSHSHASHQSPSTFNAMPILPSMHPQHPMQPFGATTSRMHAPEPPPHNNVELTREMIIQVLDRLSEVLIEPIFFGKDGRNGGMRTSTLSGHESAGSLAGFSGGAFGNQGLGSRQPLIRLITHGGASLLLDKQMFGLGLNMPLSVDPNAMPPSVPIVNGYAYGNTAWSANARFNAGYGPSGSGSVSRDTSTQPTAQKGLHISSIPRRTTTRDVDILLRAFVVDYGGMNVADIVPHGMRAVLEKSTPLTHNSNPDAGASWGEYNQNQGKSNETGAAGGGSLAMQNIINSNTAVQTLKAAIKYVAQYYFPGLGADWMNADADVALPMAMDPQTHIPFDPLHNSAITPQNLSLYTVYTSPNGVLQLVSVAPYWSVALKLVRWGRRDWGDIGVLLRNGTLLSQTQWTPELLRSWLESNCWAMGYATWDAKKHAEMDERLKLAVGMIERWDVGVLPITESRGTNNVRDGRPDVKQLGSWGTWVGGSEREKGLQGRNQNHSQALFVPPNAAAYRNKQHESEDEEEEETEEEDYDDDKYDEYGRMVQTRTRMRTRERGKDRDRSRSRSAPRGISTNNSSHGHHQYRFDSQGDRTSQAWHPAARSTDPMVRAQSYGARSSGSASTSSTLVSIPYSHSVPVPHDRGHWAQQGDGVGQRSLPASSRMPPPGPLPTAPPDFDSSGEEDDAERHRHRHFSQNRDRDAHQYRTDVHDQPTHPTGSRHSRSEHSYLHSPDESSDDITSDSDSSFDDRRDHSRHRLEREGRREKHEIYDYSRSNHDINRDPRRDARPLSHSVSGSGVVPRPLSVFESSRHSSSAKPVLPMPPLSDTYAHSRSRDHNPRPSSQHYRAQSHSSHSYAQPSSRTRESSYRDPYRESNPSLSHRDRTSQLRDTHSYHRSYTPDRGYDSDSYATSYPLPLTHEQKRRKLLLKKREKKRDQEREKGEKRRLRAPEKLDLPTSSRNKYQGSQKDNNKDRARKEWDRSGDRGRDHDQERNRSKHKDHQRDLEKQWRDKYPSSYSRSKSQDPYDRPGSRASMPSITSTTIKAQLSKTTSKSGSQSQSRTAPSPSKILSNVPPPSYASSQSYSIHRGVVIEEDEDDLVEPLRAEAWGTVDMDGHKYHYPIHGASSRASSAVAATRSNSGGSGTLVNGGTTGKPSPIKETFSTSTWGTSSSGSTSTKSPPTSPTARPAIPSRPPTTRSNSIPIPPNSRTTITTNQTRTESKTETYPYPPAPVLFIPGPAPPPRPAGGVAIPVVRPPEGRKVAVVVPPPLPTVPIIPPTVLPGSALSSLSTTAPKGVIPPPPVGVRDSQMSNGSQKSSGSTGMNAFSGLMGLLGGRKNSSG